MKKLVLFLALGFYATTNNIHARVIVNPVEVDFNLIDINASDILLVNSQTNETFVFATAKEFFAACPSLSSAVYTVCYSLDGERHKQYFKISSSVRQYDATCGRSFLGGN